MSEQVYIHYVDFSGNAYTYTMSETERRNACKMVKVSNFDNSAFRAWRYKQNPHDSKFEYDGGYIDDKAIARIWYTVQDVH